MMGVLSELGSEVGLGGGGGCEIVTDHHVGQFRVIGVWGL